MDKKYLEECLSKNMSQREISRDCGKSRSTVKYWLDVHELLLEVNNIPDGHKECGKCHEVLLIENFNVRSDNGKPAPYCKKCYVDNSIKRRRELKKNAMEYKGGCCEYCGYKSIPEVYDFHHLDPKEKDFGISKKGYCHSWEKVKIELDKCVMLCSNCHREEHAKLK